MTPPPPMLPASGQVTARAKATATVASTALPPFFRTAAPASDAGAETDTTMPLRPEALGPASTPAGRAAQQRSRAGPRATFRSEVVIGVLSGGRDVLGCSTDVRHPSKPMF